MKDLISYFELRSRLYKLLSFPYHQEIHTGYLDDLQRYLPVLRELAAQIPQDNPGKDNMITGTEELCQYFQGDFPREKSLEELKCTFASLFLGVMTTKSITPYESVYLSGSLMQDERDQVLEIYCNEKIGKSPGFKEPEDHLCAELTFLSLMSRSTAEAMHQDDSQTVKAKVDIQVSFLETHLHKWISALSNDIISVAEILRDHTPYGSAHLYRAVSKITEGFVLADLPFLEDLFETVTA